MGGALSILKGLGTLRGENGLEGSLGVSKVLEWSGKFRNRLIPSIVAGNLSKVLNSFKNMEERLRLCLVRLLTLYNLRLPKPRRCLIYTTCFPHPLSLTISPPSVK